MRNFAIFVLVLAFWFCVLSLDKTFAQSKILINEFLIDPQPQQVELYNSGSEIVDISGWTIDDSGGTTFYTIPQSSTIYPNSCLVFSHDFNFNKTSPDTIKLINNTELIDSFLYKTSSGSGISFYRLPDGDNNWTTGSSTLGLFNSSGLSCQISPTATPTLTPTTTLTPSPTLTISPTPQPTLYPTVKVKTPTPTIYIKVSTKTFPTIRPRSLNYSKLSTQTGNILGESSETVINNHLIIRILTVVSFIYSLLTIMAVLFKMKSIYGKIEKFFPTLIYTERRE